MRENEYMLILLRLMEEKSGWGSSEEWTNYNFSLLSDEIKKETGKRVSDSTLKRIFGKKKTKTELYNPHKYTKNILAEYLGYENWDHFRKEHLKDEPPSAKLSVLRKPDRKRRYIIPGAIVITAIAVVLIIFQFSFFEKEPVNPLISMECENSTGIVPYTAVFNYELIDTQDSILIDFGNNEEYFLSPKRNMITQFYPGADYATVKVFRGNEVLCTSKIHILSDGWQAGFSPNDTMQAYRPFDNQYIMNLKGRLHIPMEKLEEEGLDMKQGSFIEFRYFDKFNIPLDSLRFLTRVKNSPEEGGKRCYDIEIILRGEKSDFVVRFLEPGCFRYVRFNVGEKRYFGRFHDLSVFARDVSDWREVEILISNGEAVILFEDEVIRREDYSELMGELKGIIYRFYGNGSVDYVELESEGNIILKDDFNLVSF